MSLANDETLDSSFGSLAAAATCSAGASASNVRLTVPDAHYCRGKADESEILNSQLHTRVCRSLAATLNVINWRKVAAIGHCVRLFRWLVFVCQCVVRNSSLTAQTEHNINFQGVQNEKTIRSAMCRGRTGGLRLNPNRTDNVWHLHHDGQVSAIRDDGRRRNRCFKRR